MFRSKLLRLLFLASLPCGVANAHVGSPDVYVQVKAGPYPLFLSIHAPDVLPGVAAIVVHSEDGRVTAASVSPTMMTGEASKHPPSPEALSAVAGSGGKDFAGSVWIMSSGAWEVRFHVDGAAGGADVALPLPSTATQIRGMKSGMGAMLAVLGIVLIIGMIGIVAAGSREAVLAPGDMPDDARRKRGTRAAVITAIVMFGAVVLGDLWWNAAAADYGRGLYKPLDAKAAVYDDVLRLWLTDPGWLTSRKLDDLVPDHGHLMHLYAIRWPQMDAVYHLHPDQQRRGRFDQPLPAMVDGDYRLYGDIVHANGFAETVTTDVSLKRTRGAFRSDEAGGPLQSINAANVQAKEFVLPDGFRFRFERPDRITAKSGLMLRFALFDPAGKPAPQMERYMGMSGHAAIVKDDGSVFAHIHPQGSVAMAAYMMANPSMAMDGTSNEMMTMPDGTAMPMGEVGISPAVAGDALTNEVAFPYGFPTAGRYRVIVQMKNAGVIETGAFDVDVR